MSPSVEIYVKLLDEGVDVWRPVRAEHLQDDIYSIIDQPYDRETESWEFEPGDEVMCEVIDLYEGRTLAATRRRRS